MSTMAKLLLLFTLIPILEITLLIQLHEVLGTWATMGIICGTALTGTTLTKWQGTMALSRIKETLSQGGMPTEEILDGVLILVSGVMLITPGILTDTAGLLLLLPFVRKPVRAFAKRRVMRWLEEKTRSMVSVEYGEQMGTGAQFHGFEDDLSGGFVDRRGRDPGVIDITPE